MEYRRRAAALIRKVASVVDDAPGEASRGDRVCPLCDFAGPFTVAGQTFRRLDARCPRCGSMERHRLLRRFLESSDVLASRPRLLHFAPEGPISNFVAPRCERYVTADYMRTDVDIRIDIEKIELESNSFDVVICFDVLEHVDDEKALGELFRILAVGGSALLHVPIVEGMDETYENPSITGERDRILHFWQRDHVRLYGRDFRDRVRKAGFVLDEFFAPVSECIRYSLIVGERVFVARKLSDSRA